MGRTTRPYGRGRGGPPHRGGRRRSRRPAAPAIRGPVDAVAGVEEDAGVGSEAGRESRAARPIVQREPGGGVRQRDEPFGDPEPRVEHLGMALAPRRPVVKKYDALRQHHGAGRPADQRAAIQELPSAEQAQAAEQVPDVPALQHDRLRVLEARVHLAPLQSHGIALGGRHAALELRPDLGHAAQVPRVEAPDGVEGFAALGSKYRLVAAQFGQPPVRLDETVEAQIVGASERPEPAPRLPVRARKLRVRFGDPVRAPIEFKIHDAVCEAGIDEPLVRFPVPPPGGDGRDPRAGRQRPRRLQFPHHVRERKAGASRTEEDERRPGPGVGSGPASSRTLMRRALAPSARPRRACGAVRRSPGAAAGARRSPCIRPPPAGWACRATAGVCR